MLGGTVELPGSEGGLGEPEPGAWQRLAIGELAGEDRQRLGGGVGPARAELGGDQVDEGEFGDVTTGVVGQVTLEGCDRLGEAAGLDVRLPQQEPGVGGNRPGRLLGQSGEQSFRIGRSPQGTISQRQLVTRVVEDGGRERRDGLARGVGRLEERLEQGHRRPVIPGHRGGAGLDQPGLAG